MATAAISSPEVAKERLDLPENTMRAAAPQVARGFVLGAVELVPGVSSGTAALVLGIYRNLIATLHHLATVAARLFRGDLQGAKKGISQVPGLWLTALGVGMLAMVFVLAGPLEYALANHPIPLAGLFFGLIAAAIILCFRQLYSTTPGTLALVGASAAVTFFLMGLSPAATGATTDTPALWTFFLAGAIAVSIMILPGISGSFVLVLLGMYAPLLAAVANRDFAVLGVFVLGALLGIGFAASGLNWLLKRYHDLVLAAMIGLMIGSIRVLWPWPSGMGGTELGLPTLSTVWMPVLLGIAGFAIVMGADFIARKMRGIDPGLTAA